MIEPPESDTAAGTPRWVKVFAIVALVVIVLVVTLLLIGGNHGPGRHGGGDALRAGVSVQQR